MSDVIIDEDILEIYINKEKAFEMVYSMTHTQALAAGFLFTQGIVKDRSDILEIQFFEQTRQCFVFLTDSARMRAAAFKNGKQIKGSSGGTLLQENAVALTCPGSHTPCLTDGQVLSLIQQHFDHSELFHKTGAVHSAGLCLPHSILCYFEDIGRHNALDKLAGNILLNGIDTHDKIATVSCRMSLEIIGKIIKTGIPIVISNAAPTLSAVNLAKRAGLTIIGFARENRFNIYTHKERIHPARNR
jgi:FdhD protein